jgi:membrane associated rhomboid family serine protease
MAETQTERMEAGMNIGLLKILFERWKGYVSAVQFVMVIFLFVKESGYSWWWVVGGFVLSLLWMWIDHRFIFKRELEQYFLHNPQMMQLRDRK